MSLSSNIEAILFAVARPLPVSLLVKTLSRSSEEVQKALEELIGMRNLPESGIHVLFHNGEVSLVSAPETASAVAAFTKEELTGDLTRPQLEALSIIAYRGPISQPEIEQIRGVNCSLILRNLLQRDLVSVQDDPKKLQPVYCVSQAFLRHMGAHDISELPSYDTFANHEEIGRLLQELNPPPV